MGKTIILTEEFVNQLKDEMAMSKFKFQQHCKVFLANLLQDSANAEPDAFFKYNGISKTKLIKALVNGNVMKQEMRPNDHDENGNPHPAKMDVSYKHIKKDGRLNDRLAAVYDSLYPDAPAKIQEATGCCTVGGSGSFLSGGDGEGYEYDVPVSGTTIRQKSHKNKGTVGGNPYNRKVSVSESVTDEDDYSTSGAAYIYCNSDRGTCVLAGRRRFAIGNNTYNPPMGYLHYNENPQQGIARECSEETGLNLSPNMFKCAGQEKWAPGKIGYNFVVNLPGDISDYNIGDGDGENDKFQWIPLNMINNLNWFYNTGDTALQLAKGSLNEAVTGEDINKSAALYVYNEDKDHNWYILCARRSNRKDDEEGGKWNPPMGHLHKGETLKDGALRECLEESGIDLSKYKSYIKQKDRHDWGSNFVLVLGDYVTPAATIDDFEAKKGDEENSKFIWLPLQDIDKKTWAWTCGENAKNFIPGEIDMDDLLSESLINRIVYNLLHEATADGTGGLPGEFTAPAFIDKETADRTPGDTCGMHDRVGNSNLEEGLSIDESIINRIVSEVLNEDTDEMAAQHVSPAMFDKFDTEFMGTGCGSQAYGWGIYVSTDESVHKGYLQNYSDTWIPGTTMVGGVRYDLEIPDDENNNYIAWDGPTDQVDWSDIGIGPEEEELINSCDTFGKVYDNVLIKLCGSDKNASLMLNRLGFVGFRISKYRNSGNRDNENPNYVIFNVNDIKIMKSEYGPYAREMAFDEKGFADTYNKWGDGRDSNKHLLYYKDKEGNVSPATIMQLLDNGYNLDELGIELKTVDSEIPDVVYYDAANSKYIFGIDDNNEYYPIIEVPSTTSITYFKYKNNPGYVYLNDISRDRKGCNYALKLDGKWRLLFDGFINTRSIDFLDGIDDIIITSFRTESKNDRNLYKINDDYKAVRLMPDNIAYASAQNARTIHIMKEVNGKYVHNFLIKSGNQWNLLMDNFYIYFNFSVDKLQTDGFAVYYYYNDSDSSRYAIISIDENGNLYNPFNNEEFTYIRSFGNGNVLACNRLDNKAILIKYDNGKLISLSNIEYDYIWSTQDANGNEIIEATVYGNKNNFYNMVTDRFDLDGNKIS